MKKIVEWFKRQIALIKWSPSRTFGEAWNETEKDLKRLQGEREFIELEVKYLPDDITPTDYRGKPYYSIHYKENGEEFVGFGTYKPEVLSKFLKENFMQGGAV